jgi:hypothetical protein
MAQSNETSFSVNLKAESGDSYVGTFKIRKRLSHAQNLRKDALRRELLGDSPAAATQDVLMSSLILATCQAHIIESPNWWSKSNGGLDLLDQEPLVEVFNKINEAQQKEAEGLQTKAEEAVKELTKG